MEFLAVVVQGVMAILVQWERSWKSLKMQGILEDLM